MKSYFTLISMLSGVAILFTQLFNFNKSEYCSFVRNVISDSGNFLFNFAIRGNERITSPMDDNLVMSTRGFMVNVNQRFSRIGQ